MTKAKKKKELSLDEKLEQALVSADKYPYKVSDNWCWVKVGTVCRFENGYAFKSDKFSEKGTRPVVRISNIKQNEIDSSRYFEGYETGDFYITPELTKEGLEYEMAMMLLTGAGLGQIDVLYLFGEEPPSYNSYARFLPYTMVMIDRYNKPEFYENLYYQAESPFLK